MLVAGLKYGGKHYHCLFVFTSSWGFNGLFESCKILTERQK